MKTALELYNGVLYELNQFSAAEFDIADFNYFVNKAVERIIDRDILIFKDTQVMSDALRTLQSEISIEFIDELSNPVRVKSLPDGIRDEINVIPTFKYVKEIGCHKSGDKVKYAAKLLTGDMESFILDNSYHRPLVNRPYYKLIGNEISIKFDNSGENDNVVISELFLEYFRYQKNIVLGQNYQTVDGQDSEFTQK